MIDIYYTLQVCDIHSWQNTNRFAGSKKEIIRKCVSSFFQSVVYAALTRDSSMHRIHIINDHSTDETVEFLKQCITKYSSDNISITLEYLSTTGIRNSILLCYEQMEQNGKDLVMQVQDDYLFTKTAIFEMIDVFIQLQLDCQTDAIVVAFHDHRYWKTIYRYKVTPRMIFPGAYQNWIQIYDIPCTFLTSKQQFSKHWDLYYKFLDLIGDPSLEAGSINKILVERGVLGVQPFTSLALHMQDEVWKDPYINWQLRWDEVNI